MTPARQLRNMTKAKRRIATSVYFSAMLITLIGGFMGWPGPILILCVFAQVAPQGRPSPPFLFPARH